MGVYSYYAKIVNEMNDIIQNSTKVYDLEGNSAGSCKKTPLATKSKNCMHSLKLIISFKECLKWTVILEPGK